MHATSLLSLGASLLLSTAVSAGPLPKVQSRDVSSSERDTILQVHNDLRRKYDADPLVWDGTIASSAQQYANTCNLWNHSPGSIFNGFSRPAYGENLAWSSTADDGVREMATRWYAKN